MNSTVIMREQVEQPLLKYTETEELILNAQKGCVESRNKLVVFNIKLVYSIVNRFKFDDRRFSSDDIFQIGVIGLMKSINNFDIDRECKFSTFAVRSIRLEIDNFIRGGYSVKVNRNTHENSQKLKRFYDAFVQEHQREPRFEEIMNDMDIDKENLLAALTATKELISLSSPKIVHDGDEDQAHSFEEFIVDDNNTIDRWIDSQSLKEKINKLSDLEKQIINLKYFSDKTQTEIGNSLSIPQWKVSRLEKSALIKLRDLI